VTKKLNLGSGDFYKPGYVNVDVVAGKADVIHDLNVFPYPFGESEFDVVEADHSLEHLNDAFGSMREIHRITKDGGTVRIRVPHFSRGFSHADHKSSFDFTFPYYFRPDFKGGYQGVEFKLEAMKLRWFAQPYLKRTVLSPTTFHAASAFGAVLNVFANLSPALCSRIWCYWFGGFEEIEFRFTAVK
jgi:SAM-dependent methyltransferase